MNTIHLKKRISQLNKSKVISVIFLAFLFALNILWFKQFDFHTLMGDDLSGWKFYHNNHSLIKTVFFSAPANKYRPVFNFIQFIQFRLFDNDYKLFFYFNICVNFIIIVSFYNLILKITNRNNTLSFLMSLIYVTSRFSYYNILQANGILEAIGILLLIWIIYYSIDFYKTGNLKFYFYLLALFTLIIFTHERYIVISLFLICLLTFKFYSKKCLKYFKYILFTLLPVIVNFTLKKVAFHAPVLEGTGGVHLAFNPLQTINFFVKGFLNMFAVNLGEPYLNGIYIRDVNRNIKFYVLAIVILYLVIFIFYVIRFIRMNSDNRKNELVISFLCLILFSSLLLSSSITFRQELRWLYAPFVVLLTYMAFIFSKISFRVLKYILLIILSVLIIKCDVYYKSFQTNVFFVSSQIISDSIYDETIKKYGTNFQNYTVFIEKHDWLNWPLESGVFFTSYLNDDKFKVNYVDSIEKFNFDKVNPKNTLIYKLDMKKLKLSEITKETLSSRNNNKP